MTVRFFTLEEASALLPHLEEIIGQILAARQRILDKRPEIWPVLEKASQNGGNLAAGAIVSEFDIIQRGVRAVADLGVTLKDVNTGLVDFLTERDGREVYLCWRYGEPEIGYWHELHTGFASRRPL